MQVTFKDKSFAHKLKGKTVKDLLLELDIPLNTVIVVQDDQIVLSDKNITKAKKIDILSAISGG